jgi:hypothetical protein
MFSQSRNGCMPLQHLRLNASLPRASPNVAPLFLGLETISKNPSTQIHGRLSLLQRRLPISENCTPSAAQRSSAAPLRIYVASPTSSFCIRLVTARQTRQIRQSLPKMASISTARTATPTTPLLHRNPLRKPRARADQSCPTCPQTAASANGSCTMTSSPSCRPTSTKPSTCPPACPTRRGSSYKTG